MYSKTFFIFILVFLFSCKNAENQAESETKKTPISVDSSKIEKPKIYDSNDFKYYVGLCGQPYTTEAQPDQLKKLRNLEIIALNDLMIKEKPKNITWFVRAAHEQPNVIYVMTGFKYIYPDNKIANVEVFFENDKLDLINFSFPVNKDNTLQSEYPDDKIDIIKKTIAKDGFKLENILFYSNYDKAGRIFMTSVTVQKKSGGNSNYIQYFFKSNFEYIDKSEFPSDI